jgi:DNA-binding PucR family transcriptional regulator
VPGGIGFGSALATRRGLIARLRKQEPALTETLRVYLDSFGDVASAFSRLHVRANTVRYRVRRIEKLLGTLLSDPDSRLLLALGLRVGE